MAGYQRNPYGRDRQIPLTNINPGYEEPQFSEVFDYSQVESGAGSGIPQEPLEGAAAGYQDIGPSQDLRQRSQWAKDEKRDTAILLESLPSKQLEKMASEIAHSGSFRKKSTQRKSLHGALHIPAGRDVSEDLIRSCEDDPDLIDELEDEIKGMTMTMSQKRKLKNQVSLKRKKPKMISRWKRFKYNIGIKMKHLKYNLLEFLSFFNLWTGHLKKIEGHFGTGVLSYFLFLKWLFFINLPIFILTFGFVILPQVLYRHLEGGGYKQDVAFTGKELLTGAGWFEDTELYYGHYTSETINLSGDSVYNMKYAYLFTCGGYYILCLIILAISISKSYKKNYIEGSGAYNFYNVTRIFCGWDYGITAKESAKLKQKSIFNEFKEYLSGIKEEEEQKTCGEMCKWVFIRLLTNLIIIGLIGGSGYLIYYISVQQSVSVTIPVLSEMAMPLCVSGVNLILPFFFSLIARLESYVKPKHELYINMLRTMLLKAVTLGVLVYYWYQIMREDVPCWETFIGQQIYRLMIVDFLFILFTTFFVEFIRRLMKDYCIAALASPEFEIGRNTLNLIYSQALCWLGTYFAPMLSLIAIIKLFLLFYVKRISVIQNCKPSLRPWRASRSHTIFLGFLFCFFLLATAAVTSAVIFLKPSTTCGPFVNHTTSYEIVVNLVDSWKGQYSVLHEIIQVISSSGFIAGTLILLLVVTYYMRIVMVGHKEMVELLRQQLSMEGRDKAYLLKMLQDANKRYRGEGRSTLGVRPQTAIVGDSVSPGGRTFIKQIADTQRTTDLTPQRPRRNKQGPGGTGAAM